jgi:hypothetical protein
MGSRVSEDVWFEYEYVGGIDSDVVSILLVHSGVTLSSQCVRYSMVGIKQLMHTRSFFTSRKNVRQLSQQLIHCLVARVKASRVNVLTPLNVVEVCSLDAAMHVLNCWILMTRH